MKKEIKVGSSYKWPTATCDYWEESDCRWLEGTKYFTTVPTSFARKNYVYAEMGGFIVSVTPYFTIRKNLDSYMIAYTVSGNGFLNYGEDYFNLAEGSLFFINCQKLNKFGAAKNSGWDLFILHINGSMVEDYYQKFRTGYGTVAYFGKTLRSSFEEILNSMQDNSTERELITHTRIIGLLDTICASDGDEIVAGKGIYPQIVAMVRQKLEYDFSKSFTLDQLAEEFCANKYMLEREFKKITGFSIIEYLIHVRLKHAEELLVQTDFPIRQIAYDVGWENAPYFITAFKKRKGMTPGQYRIKFRSGESDKKILN